MAIKLQKRRAASDNIGKIVFALVLVLVMVYAVWFFSTHHKVTINDIYTPKPDVVKNPYFAATLMLQKQGKTGEYISPADADSRLEALWQDTTHAKSHTVIIEQMASTPEHQLERMVSWIQAGGHLVIYNQTTHYDDQEWQDYVKNENPLMIHLGISSQFKRNNFEDNTLDLRYDSLPILIDNKVVVLRSNLDRFNTKPFFDNYPDARWVYDYQAIGKGISQQQLYANFYELNTKQKQQLFEFSNKNIGYGNPSQVLVDVHLGDGRLTVLNDRIDFSNPWPDKYGFAQSTKPADPNSPRVLQLLSGNIRSTAYYGGITDADHAYFLSKLTQDSQTIWFVPRTFSDPKGFMGLMREHLPFVLIAVVLAIIAMLMALPRQFGRKQVIVDDSNRNLMLYFDGVGQYLWATDLCVAQVHTNRERLLEKIQARLPKVSRADNKTACQLIAEDANLPVSMVYEALYGEWQTQSEFVKISRSFALLADVYL